MATVKQRWRAGRLVGWEVRWRDTANSQRKRLFPKKGDADRFRTGVEHQLLTGTYVDPASGRTTVGQWSRVWLDQRVHLKPKTLAGYESLLRSRVLPRWAGVQLGRVTHADVVAWVSSMRAEGLSPSRTRAAYHLLTAMLDDAVKRG
jgi:hypothetical protein